jgi:hypothetical protein
LRDALSLTDQLLALAGSQPTLEDVSASPAAAARPSSTSCSSASSRAIGAALLEALGAQRGRRAELMAELLDHVRGGLLSALCARESALLESEPAERERRARARGAPGTRAPRAVAERAARRARAHGEIESQARVVLELCLLDLSRPELTLPIEELAQRLLALEQRLGGAARGLRRARVRSGRTRRARTSAARSPDARLQRNRSSASGESAARGVPERGAG